MGLDPEGLIVLDEIGAGALRVEKKGPAGVFVRSDPGDGTGQAYRLGEHDGLRDPVEAF